MKPYLLCINKYCVTLYTLFCICIPFSFAQDFPLKDVSKLIIMEFSNKDYETAALNALDYLIQRTNKDNPSNFEFYDSNGFVTPYLHECLRSRHDVGIHHSNIQFEYAQNDLEAIIFYYGAMSFYNLAVSQYTYYESSIAHFKTKEKFHRDDVYVAYLYMAYIFADLYVTYSYFETIFGERQKSHARTRYNFMLAIDGLKIQEVIEHDFEILAPGKQFYKYLRIRDAFQGGYKVTPAKKQLKEMENRQRMYLRKYALLENDIKDIQSYLINILNEN